MKEQTMTELKAKLTTHLQQQNIESRRVSKNIVVATAVLIVLGGAVVLFAQGQDKDKSSLISPGKIAFSDFRGYEDWSAVSSAHPAGVLKVIVATPPMIKAYKS